MSVVTVVNVLPGLLGTYGDTGNAIALAHRLHARSLPVEVIRVDAGDPVPTGGDVYLVGGGEDRAQALAAGLIGDALARAVEAGATVVGVCAGLQILGRLWTDTSGTTHTGLGLLDVETEPLPHRAVGEAVVECAMPGVGRVVGFENHRGGTRLGPEARPLATVDGGVGNVLTPGTEGAWSGRVIGTYLHGPVLALNPALADYLLEGVVGSLPPMDDDLALRARALRLDPRAIPARVAAPE
jgi:lipid II isoglutaminyl synthase (glutamine-hydrolysing)